MSCVVFVSSIVVELRTKDSSSVVFNDSTLDVAWMMSIERKCLRMSNNSWPPTNLAQLWDNLVTSRSRLPLTVASRIVSFQSHLSDRVASYITPRLSSLLHNFFRLEVDWLWWRLQLLHSHANYASTVSVRSTAFRSRLCFVSQTFWQCERVTKFVNDFAILRWMIVNVSKTYDTLCCINWNRKWSFTSEYWMILNRFQVEDVTNFCLVSHTIA